MPGEAVFAQDSAHDVACLGPDERIGAVADAVLRHGGEGCGIAEGAVDDVVPRIVRPVARRKDGLHSRGCGGVTGGMDTGLQPGGVDTAEDPAQFANPLRVTAALDYQPPVGAGLAIWFAHPGRSTARDSVGEDLDSGDPQLPGVDTPG